MVNLTLSVHQLVDFLLRQGDIDNRIYNRNTMVMGSQVHAYYQKKQNNKYISEYPLKEEFFVNDFNITLQGRADGIIIDQDDKVTIDEIKSTVTGLEDFYMSQKEWHLGQAKCYALMYAHEKKLKEISICLTYISQIDDSQMQKKFSYKVEDLELYVNRLLHRYIDFYTMIYQRKVNRNHSAAQLSFPFKDVRKGQKDLVMNVYQVAKNGGTLYVEAPTGIGKTMATLFPYVYSFKNEFNDKIFYLTAKTSGRESAYKACEILKDNGLKASEILITAKDKICFNTGKACNPKECPYAVAYYNKIQNVLIEMLVKESSFNYDTIIKYAADNEICPFELELDLSLYVDIIICDYNYLFDPQVYMKRYFDEDASHFICLIDEAHNLVDRSREMYSCSLDYDAFKKAKKICANLEDTKYKNVFNKLNREFKKYLELYSEENENILLENLNDSFVIALNSFFKTGQKIMKDCEEFITDEFTSFFFDVNKMIKLYEYYCNRFKVFLTFKDSKKFTINLLCVDASGFVKECLGKVKGSTIFSATFSPIDYYINELGGDNDSKRLLLDSPFPIENQLVMVQTNVSTKYAKRDESIDNVVESINVFIRQKIGNYFVFFPSYQYMKSVLEKMSFDDDIIVYEQSTDMNEKERDNFLNNFKENPTKITVGFVVLGGVFAEGIDLLNDRLIGAVVVGVGLPRINFKNDLIMEYHNNKNEQGFNYAYSNIGINRVMQAIGRVIRSETDKGTILLIDERYAYGQYKKMFRGQLRYYQLVKSSSDIRNLTNQFWNKK